MRKVVREGRLGGRFFFVCLCEKGGRGEKAERMSEDVQQCGNEVVDECGLES